MFICVADHNLITKPDGKPTQQGPQVAKTTATTPAVAKVKAVKRDVVDREMLRHVETQLHHAAKGFDAVSALFQYLVNDVSTITITLSLHASYSSPPSYRQWHTGGGGGVYCTQTVSVGYTVSSSTTMYPALFVRLRV